MAVRAAACGNAAACAAVRRYVAVRAAMCGRAQGGVHLFVFRIFRYMVCVLLYQVEFELSYTFVI